MSLLGELRFYVLFTCTTTPDCLVFNQGVPGNLWCIALQVSYNLSKLFSYMIPSLPFTVYSLHINERAAVGPSLN